MGRYDRNIGTITIEDQAVLACKSVCVVGCGGLGGGVIENLTRMGIGEITVVDGDVFDESNLNRQVISNEENLGKSKALEAVEQMSRINSEVTFVAVTDLLDADNAEAIIAGCDMVVDALDNSGTRIVLEKTCEELNIPLVHGAISGWNGQVGICMPGSKMMSKLYGEGAGTDESPTNPSFTPAVVSALQASEAIKLMLCMEEALVNKLLMIDLLDHEYEIIDFGG